MGQATASVEQGSAMDVLDDTWAYFKDHPQPLAEAVYQKLQTTKPEFPPLRFSNGDLWLEYLIDRDQKLAGVIDFQSASFSDPVFEFLLSFFVEPKLQGRGLEQRYCQRLGLNPDILHWFLSQ